MIPEYIPVFVADDIIPPPAKEYEDNKGRRSTVGWLKELFLYQSVIKNHIVIQDTDRKDYKKALDIFRNTNKIKSSVNLHEWEEQNTAKTQAAALNKLRKAMK